MVDLVRVMGRMVVVVVLQLVALVVMEAAAMMQALGAVMEVVVQALSTEVEAGMVVQGMVGTIPTEDKNVVFR